MRALLAAFASLRLPIVPTRYPPPASRFYISSSQHWFPLSPLHHGEGREHFFLTGSSLDFSYSTFDDASSITNLSLSDEAMAQTDLSCQGSLLPLISYEWSKRLVEECSGSRDRTEHAVRRTIALLSGDDASTVPFLCRYRTDIIHPLSPTQVHTLQDWVDRHSTLSSQRIKAVRALDEHFSEKDNREYQEKRKRMVVTTSKSELDELYAPFKPPAKGSIAERIASARPDLVRAVDRFWKGEMNKHDFKKFLDYLKRKDTDSNGMSTRECIVYLLGSDIAASPNVCDAVMQLSRRNCVVSVKKAPPAKGDDEDKNRRSKYEQYFDFECPAARLKDYQVLAIRRGINTKELKMTIAVLDDDFLKRQIKKTLLEKTLPNSTLQHTSNPLMKPILSEAIDDAWSRLLKRRSSQAVWRDKIARAEQRGITVFANNVKSALMAPPQKHPTYVLALDPGHRAGIKVALLNSRGGVLDHPMALSTVHFLGNRKEAAIEKTSELLRILQKERGLEAKDREEPVSVALGNGHGCDEARTLIESASSQSRIPIDITVVNEAGASVWSVTDAAAAEFPGKQPTSIGAVSLGRRMQDPMNELVKVPPRSLGLGMYQHDLPEKELDEKLNTASIDQVALVGVDANSCSLELLRNVPGLTRGKLAENVVNARPFSSREKLKKVKGLGPKAFENCAGFIRIRPEDGEEILDSTRCHPESYPVARWIMQSLGCAWVDLPGKLPVKDSEGWEELVGGAARRYDISAARVENIIDLLIDSEDPRFRNGAVNGNEKLNEILTTLPRNLAKNLSELKDACPVRNIVGTVRNVADFGAFIDFGAENDGLLHNSKMGSIHKNQLAVGRRIGVDILGVCVETGRISLSKAGCGYDAVSEIFLPRNKRKFSSERSAPQRKRQRR